MVPAVEIIAPDEGGDAGDIQRVAGVHWCDEADEALPVRPVLARLVVARVHQQLAVLCDGVLPALENSEGCPSGNEDTVSNLSTLQGDGRQPGGGLHAEQVVVAAGERGPPPAALLCSLREGDGGRDLVLVCGDQGTRSEREKEFAAVVVRPVGVLSDDLGGGPAAVVGRAKDEGVEQVCSSHGLTLRLRELRRRDIHRQDRLRHRLAAGDDLFSASDHQKCRETPEGKGQK